MQIKQITVGAIAENCYALVCKNETVLVDPGAEFERLAREAEKPVTHVLLTHAHFDHIGCVAAFQKQGAKVYLHRDDVPLLNSDGNLAAMFGETLDAFTPDVVLSGGETLHLPCGDVQVLHTPGHTSGGVCYALGDCLFTGDTLFYLSVGRSDFPTGDGETLARSLKNVLFALDGEYKVFPGHDRTTTLNFEKKNNPYA